MSSENREERPKRERTAIWLVSYGLFFTGLFLIMVSVLGAEVHKWPVWCSAFVRDLGLLLSAVMAGTLLHDKLLRDEMVKFTGEKLGQELDARIPKPDRSALLTAQAVHQLFKESPPEMTGLRLLAERRRNFSGYYRWVNERSPQDLFFAGRSVLHRIDADIKANTANVQSSAEDVLFRHLKEGSKIRILFLDPRTDILSRLAREEGQTMEALLGDIAKSIAICDRLHYLLRTQYTSLLPSAELTIRVYDRVPYFAYHKQDDEVIVGFYFLSSVGSSSAAYDLVDPKTKQVFSGHFDRIMSDAVVTSLVEFDGSRGRPSVNATLLNELRVFCETLLSKSKAGQLSDKNNQGGTMNKA